MKIIFFLPIFFIGFLVKAQSLDLNIIKKFDVAYNVIDNHSNDSVVFVKPSIVFSISDTTNISSFSLEILDGVNSVKQLNVPYSKNGLQQNSFSLTTDSSIIKLELNFSIPLKLYQYNLVLMNNSNEIITQYTDSK